MSSSTGCARSLRRLKACWMKCTARSSGLGKTAGRWTGATATAHTNTNWTRSRKSTASIIPLSGTRMDEPSNQYEFETKIDIGRELKQPGQKEEAPNFNKKV